MKEPVGKLSILLLAACLVGIPAGARADLPAPNWMPNSPIMAGPQVILLWMPVPGATKYHIYLNGKKIGESAAIQHILAAPEAPGDYEFKIAGVDGAGKEGPLSAAGIVKIITVEPPKGLITRIAEGKILLRWDKTKGAAIYNVYRSESRESGFKLLTSVQSEAYTDAEVARGKSYWYAVSSKDLSGKESKRGEPVNVSLAAEAKAAQQAVKYEMKVVPSTETARLGFLDGKRMAGVTDIAFAEKSKQIWIVQGDRIYQASTAGEVTGKIGPVAGVTKFWKVDFGDDGTIYASTLEGKLYALKPSGEVLWSVDLPKPPLDDKEIWAGITETTKKTYGPTGGDVLVNGDEIWVSDQVFAILYVFDRAGKFRRYVYRYTDADGKVTRMGGIGEMEHTADGRLVFTFPVAHFAVVLDKNLKEQFSIGKAGNGFIGAFIGIHGLQVMADGNILLTDPSVNSMQVFDGKTGKYLYHLGGEEAKEDPAQAGRPPLDFGQLNFAHMISPKEFFVYAGTEQAILFRTLKK